MQEKIISLIVLIACSGFFSAAETALFTLSSLKVKHLAKSRVPGAKAVEKLKENPHRLLVTILIGNNLVNIGASAIATSLAFELSLNNAVSITTGVMTFLVLVFGEIIPKSSATIYNQKIAIISAGPIMIMQKLMFPVIIFFESITVVMRMVFGKEIQPSITEDELKTIVSAAEEEGEIKESESEMINRIFRFDDIAAKDVMTPRARMTCIDINNSVVEAAEISSKKGHSRMPVCRKNPDRVEGLVHVKDIQKAMLEDPKIEVGKVMRKILFVPSTKKLDSLLKFFQRKKQAMAIVVDDFGTNIGLITMEDILEEIVGEIMDETEKVMPKVRQEGANRFIVDGNADIGEINSKCGKVLPETEAPNPVSSFILKKLGRIPEEGEDIQFAKCRIKIEKMSKNAIEKVVVTIKK